MSTIVIKETPFIKLITEIINKNLNLLKEGLSQRLFHFCSLDAAYNIIKSDCFMLTNVEQNKSDKRMNSFISGIDNNGKPIYKTYNYYMCFSRTPSTSDGYVRQRRLTDSSWKSFVVRIELDGELLNTKYKGKAVNAFPNTKETLKSPKVSKFFKNNVYTMPKGKGDLYPNEMVFNDNTKIPSIFEHEDRLFSNQDKIPNFKKYIKEIDVLIDQSILNKPDKYNESFIELNFILNNFDNVYIYDNEKSFNTLNIRNSKHLLQLKKYILNFGNQFEPLNKSGFIKKYQTNLNSKTSLYLNKTMLGKLGKILSILSFNKKNYKGQYLSDALKLAETIGLSEKEINLLSKYLLVFENYKSSNFSYIATMDKMINRTLIDLRIKAPNVAQKLQKIIDENKEMLGVKSICYGKAKLPKELYNKSPK